MASCNLQQEMKEHLLMYYIIDIIAIVGKFTTYDKSILPSMSPIAKQIANI